MKYLIRQLSGYYLNRSKRLISLFLIATLVMLPNSISLAAQCHSDARDQVVHQHTQQLEFDSHALDQHATDERVVQLNDDVSNDHSHTFSHDCVSCNTLPVSTVDYSSTINDEIPVFLPVTYTPALLALDKKPPRNIL